MKITLGSLFDGIGGFPLAAERNGITPIWASEIEKYCILITKIRFPNMLHLGDITEINGKNLEPVDIITMGSPCQDLSIAGKQQGLVGKRSGLFFEGIRIVQEMQESTNGEYPRFLIWENVNGAIYSNKGYDFRIVLEEIAKTHIPIPNSGKWAGAGMVRSNKCERLQGFPDNWTQINNSLCVDSTRFRIIGNSIAIPCADYIFSRMLKYGFEKN